jgi:DNA-directed RNA polymerase subunit alpha
LRVRGVQRAIPPFSVPCVRGMRTGALHQPYRCNEPGVLRGSLHANEFAETQSHQRGTTGANRAKVTLEPFERGYGHTLGNAMRRVLLSSMVGYAATEVTIAGVLHEYSSIDGVQEDVVNILLNLKGVVFKLHNRDEVTLSLRKDGEGHGHRCRHPDAARRRDHQPRARHRQPVARRQDRHADQGGKGPWLCAWHHAPLWRRADQVDWPHCAGCVVLAGQARELHRGKRPCEQRTDLDKLVVEIETNGAITAEDAVRASAKILVEQLAVFAQLEGNELAAFDAPVPAQQRSSSTRSCCVPWTSSNSRCARPTA